MSVKTFVITLPKPLPPGAQVKGVVTPQMISDLTAGGGSSSIMDFSGNKIRFIKEEPSQVIEVNEKPARKRQKLDHLSYEEKLMRRKLKNRVAAQTARDRKKIRMDELELQVSELTSQLSEMTSLVETLTMQNRLLEEKNEFLTTSSQCTCRVIGNSVSRKPASLSKHTNTLVERKTPVSSVTEQSAALPQPRAVTLQAAALWVLFLKIVLLCQSGMGGLQPQASTESLQLPKRNEEIPQLQRNPSDYRSRETPQKWKLQPQPPWKLHTPTTT